MATKEIDITKLNEQGLALYAGQSAEAAAQVVALRAQRDEADAVSQAHTGGRELAERLQAAKDAEEAIQKRFTALEAQSPGVAEGVSHADALVKELIVTIDTVVKAAAKHGHDASTFGVPDRSGDFRHALEIAIINRVATLLHGSGFQIRTGSVHRHDEMPSAAAAVGKWVDSQVAEVRLHLAKRAQPTAEAAE